MSDPRPTPSELTTRIARLRQHFAERIVPLWQGPGWNADMALPYEALDAAHHMHPFTDANGLATKGARIITRGKGLFVVTEYVATDEKVTRRFPLLLTTGRILSQYNVGAQTRRTENVAWHDEDRLEIHPTDAESRGINEGDWVGITSRAGETVLRAVAPNCRVVRPPARAPPAWSCRECRIRSR